MADDTAGETADAGEARVSAPTARRPGEETAEITVVGDDDMARSGAPVKEICALFGEDQAHMQVTPAITR